MDTTKIVQLGLQKKDFKKLNFSENYSTLFVDKTNYQKYILELLCVSDLIFMKILNGKVFQTKIHFTEDLTTTHIVYFGFIMKNQSDVWSNYNITPLWEESIQELKEGEIYGGGGSYLEK